LQFFRVSLKSQRGRFWRCFAATWSLRKDDAPRIADTQTSRGRKVQSLLDGGQREFSLAARPTDSAARRLSNIAATKTEMGPESP
jgi:hypothetical protein